ncbi:PREDICTED: uncharacterized protein LOC108566585 isoform X1 [Nicrophorus vespilloides]|uniref:Uncharacterized protein LOC108566585 isoform X1 n=1 Tax=Nicrophorus vespilloides TaxID=110193 RepID=A0ABM1N5E6_NICVS|nr:PREDICTED: uncharacterized protein LOC108566585 isoform X1 [Nicrophorus vespilloides]
MTKYTRISIYWITFFEATCIGILMPILNTHIFTLQGSHKITGIIAAVSILSETYSKKILAKNTANPESILFKYLLIELITNIILGLSTNLYLVATARIIFNLFNQTNTLCKRIISKNVASEDLSSTYSTINLLYILGLIFGPVLSGHLYQNNKTFLPDMCKGDTCFYSVASALTTLNLISTTLAFCIPTCEAVENLEENEPRADPLKYPPWQIKTLRFLSRISIWVFSSKFSLLIKELYGATPIQIGYTLSFHFIIFFVATFLLNTKIKFDPKRYAHMNFLIGTTILCMSMIMACLSHSFFMFLLNSFPLIVARVYMDWTYKSLYCDSASISKTNKYLDMMLPFIFGVFCDIYLNDAFRVFCILPLILAVLLSIYYDSFINDCSVQTQIHIHDD